MNGPDRVQPPVLPLRTRRDRAQLLLWAGITMFLLGGVWADRTVFHTPARDVGPYHARVREAAQAAPLRIGSWVGAESPLPPAAVALLHANAVVSRSYQDSVAGRRVTFLLVHCSDARDLLGHYPPVCYAAAGWTLATAEPRDWRVDGLEIHGMCYEFASGRFDRPELATIANFMVLPDGTTCRDMDGVTNNARNPRKKFFGAAQVQLVSDGAVGKAECDELVSTFVRANRPLLGTILSGVTRDE
jgi:hypothetical protein